MKKKRDEEEMGEDEGRRAIYIYIWCVLHPCAPSHFHWATEDPNKHTAHAGVWEGVNSNAMRQVLVGTARGKGQCEESGRTFGRLQCLLPYAPSHI